MLGILTTAGNVLFTAGSGGLEALNATTGARAFVAEWRAGRQAGHRVIVGRRP